MNAKPLDKVTNAYKGEMGEDFRRKTRDRINWIVNHTTGKKILDIGCSQGIVPIILGREGKKVEAIDIAQESIDYALEDLKDEHCTVQENVMFRVSNFMNDETLDSDYETVLLTEVLEHLSDPYSCMEKIHTHLTEGGRLIVTVPFGINDYFDHKRTYYYTDLVDHVSACFEIEKIEYLGNWVGVVCQKKHKAAYEKASCYRREEIEHLEKGFNKLERGLVTKIEDLQRMLQKEKRQMKSLQAVQANDGNKQVPILQEKVNELQHQLNEERKKGELLSGENQKLQQLVTGQKRELEFQIKRAEEASRKERLLSDKNATLLKQIDDKGGLIKDLNNQIDDKGDLIMDLNNQIETMKSEYLNSLNSEEQALNQYLEEREKNTEKDAEILRLERRIQSIEKKYAALKNSKLGKVTLKYWEKKRKFSKRT